VVETAVGEGLAASEFVVAAVVVSANDSAFFSSLFRVRRNFSGKTSFYGDYG